MNTLPCTPHFLTLALTLLGGALSSWAQPVLNASDLPQGGETYLRTNAAPPLFADDLETGGADLTWNYSDLIPTNDQETEYFQMGEASFTTQLVFSSADHFTAFELPDLGLENPLPFSGATTYLEFGSGAYKVVGLGITTDFVDLPVIYDDEEELLPLPLEYGATLSSTSAFNVNLPDLLYYSTAQTAEIEVDAWGTLNLPGGSYECLRVKRSYFAEDSVSIAGGVGFGIPREGTTYEWYAAGEGMPVLSVQSIVGIPGIWTYKPAEVTNAITPMAQRIHLGIAPNPAQLSSTVTLQHDLPLPLPVSVVNAMGRVVYDGQLGAGHGQTQLPSADWPAGTYVVQVSGAKPLAFILR